MMIMLSETKYQLHAKEVVSAMDLTKYDGIVCVSGDGILVEVSWLMFLCYCLKCVVCVFVLLLNGDPFSIWYVVVFFLSFLLVLYFLVGGKWTFRKRRLECCNKDASWNGSCRFVVLVSFLVHNSCLP